MSNAADQAIEKLTTAIEAGIKGIGTMAEKYGPEVIDSALWVVRLNGLQWLILGAILAAAGVTLLVLSWREWRAMRPAIEKYEAYEKARDEWLNGKGARPDGVQRPDEGKAGIPGMIGVGLCATSIIFLGSIWNWVAIFEPKLWVAKKLLGL